MSDISDEKSRILAEIQRFEEKLEQDNALLEEYRDDFVIIDNQELLLTQLVYALKGNDDAMILMSSIKNKILEMNPKDEVEGMTEAIENKLNDLFLPNGTYAERLYSQNQSYCEYLESIGRKCDSIKSEIASKIDGLKTAINQSETALSILRSNLSCYY